MFLINSFHALVLLDLGVSQYFVSTYFSRSFHVVPGVLDRRLDFSIAGDRTVLALSVYRGCVL